MWIVLSLIALLSFALFPRVNALRSTNHSVSLHLTLTVQAPDCLSQFRIPLAVV